MYVFVLFTLHSLLLFHHLDGTTVSSYDGNGKKVPWWFVYKNSHDGQYIANIRNADGSSTHHKLTTKRTINSQHSPFMQTIAKCGGSHAASNQMFLSWNDQPADGKDHWGKTLSRTNFAHSKGFFSLAYDAAQSEIHWTIITHSFPKIPNKPRGKDVFKPSTFFGKHLETNSFAQTALSISGTQKVTLKDGAINYEPGNDSGFFAFLEGLHVAGVIVNYTNYNPKTMKVYRQLFDIRDKDGKIIASNLGRTGKSTLLPRHAFPLVPSKHYLAVDKAGKHKVRKGKSLHSLRFPGQSYMAGCTHCEQMGSCDFACFKGIHLEATDGTRFTMDFKNGLFRVDIDEMIALRMIPATDLEKARKKDKPPATNAADTIKTFASAAATIQSFYHATRLQSQHRRIQKNDLVFDAFFNNTSSVTLTRSHDSKEFKKMGSHRTIKSTRDHSKWFLVYPYGQLGVFVPAFGLFDLNRTSHMVKRGGILTVTNDPGATMFMFNLQPMIHDNNTFANAPIDNMIERSSIAKHKNVPVMNFVSWAKETTRYMNISYRDDGGNSTAAPARADKNKVNYCKVRNPYYFMKSYVDVSVDNTTTPKALNPSSSSSSYLMGRKVLETPAQIYQKQYANPTTPLLSPFIRELSKKPENTLMTTSCAQITKMAEKCKNTQKKIVF